MWINDNKDYISHVRPGVQLAVDEHKVSADCINKFDRREFDAFIQSCNAENLEPYNAAHLVIYMYNSISDGGP